LPVDPASWGSRTTRGRSTAAFRPAGCGARRPGPSEEVGRAHADRGRRAAEWAGAIGGAGERWIPAVSVGHPAGCGGTAVDRELEHRADRWSGGDSRVG